MLSVGSQDRYLSDAASGDTFMSKYEDDAMELIKTVVENSHQNSKKTIWKRCYAERTSNRRKISEDEHADNMQS